MIQQAERDLMKLLMAGVALTALFDVVVINKGQPALRLFETFWKGYGAILARGSGQTPPKGF